MYFNHHLALSFIARFPSAKKPFGRSRVGSRTADMALQQYYRKHAHKEPNKAIIKVAHKLPSRMRTVINSGIPYQEGIVK